MQWYQISVVGAERDTDGISEILLGLGAVSVTFSDAGDEPLYEPAPDSCPLWQETRVQAIFEQSVELQSVRDAVFRQLPDSRLREWKIEVLPDRVWEREWMVHFEALKFGERLWVCPSHLPPPEPDGVNLLLDPGLAFGTGTHPTTALCLEWLAGNPLDECEVIDFGCGSGILAIAAALLGAAKVIAVDIDPQALLATRDNAKKNGVQDRIVTLSRDEFGDSRADILVANILAKPLEDLAEVLGNSVYPGGWLVLSGILQDQVQGVSDFYRERFNFLPAAISEDWARLEGIRK